MNTLPPAAPGSHWQPVKDAKGQPSAFWEYVRPQGNVILDVGCPVQRATLAAYQYAAWFDAMCIRTEAADCNGRFEAYKHADAWDDVRRAAMQEARA